MLSLDSFEMNTVWDPTSARVLFPLLFAKISACTNAAWRAAKATWVEEQMQQYVSPLLVLRRAGLGIAGGTILAVLSYKTYKNWKRNRARVNTEKNVRMFANENVYTRTNIPMPEALDDDWFLLKQDEEYYLRQGLPSRIYSDFEMPMDVYMQSGISTSKWFCDLLEKHFEVNVRILEEPKKVTLYFEGPPRNITRAREYLKDVVSIFLTSRQASVSNPFTSESPETSEAPLSEPITMKIPFDHFRPQADIDHHEGDTHRP